MVDLQFQHYKFEITLTCVSEDGIVKDIETINQEIKDGLEIVFDEITGLQNSAIRFDVKSFESDGGGK